MTHQLVQAATISPWHSVQGSKLTVANVPNVTDLRLFAPKIIDLGATLLLKFLKLILVWRSKSLISFLVVNLVYRLERTYCSRKVLYGPYGKMLGFTYFSY